jgi:hypothetical protein
VHCLCGWHPLLVGNATVAMAGMSMCRAPSPPPPRAPPYMCLSWGEGPPMSVCRGMSRRGTVSSGTAMK